MARSIVFASAELAPLASTGGLGDVSRALPRALALLGHRVSVFLPLYKSVRERVAALSPVGAIHVPGYGGPFRVLAAREPLEPATLYLIEHDYFFDRDGVYGDFFGTFGDNLERFSFFSRAVIEATVALDLRPDLVHANDWHTGVLPALLRTAYGGDRRLASVKTVFTIHNLAFQGRFPGAALPVTGLPWSVFHLEGVEYYGLVNLMKAGIVFADVVTAVSPRYSQEITTPEFGEGLDGLLRSRGTKLHGILNGIDYELWNPATDPHLPAHFHAGQFAGKRRCKEALLAELGLVFPANLPLAGMISRLSSQKGVDIALGVAEDILRTGVALVVLGSGDRHLEQWLRSLAERHPGRVAARIGFDEALAHRIEAGVDIFLMPSRYEPCGLNQMYSLRYGTVPLVRGTGGLDDTVHDPEEEPGLANGFKFREPRGDQLAATLLRAVATYYDRPLWRELMRRGMKEDFSWRRSAARYAELYDRLCQ